MPVQVIGDTVYLDQEKEVSAGRLEELKVLIGTFHILTIDKLYGPWAVHNLRIRLDYESASWVVEQEAYDEDEDGNTEEPYWVERARFPGWSPEVKMNEG